MRHCLHCVLLQSTITDLKDLQSYLISITFTLGGAHEALYMYRINNNEYC